MIRPCTHCRIPHEIKGTQYLCKNCKRVHQNGLSKRNRIAWWALTSAACIKCGYSKSLAALDMHHRNPAEKLFAIGPKFNAINPDNCKPETKQQVLLEVSKCDILCSNCHREVHDG